MTRQTALFDVSIETTLGPIRSSVSVDTGPMRLVDLVPSACGLTDILAERAVDREARSGRAVTCRAGCGACCSQMVPLSPPEAFFVAELVASLPSDARTEAAVRFGAAEERLEALDMIGPLLYAEYSDDAAMAHAREYFHLGIPCPFLAEGSCGIYENRPVACREYNVTSPAQRCEGPFAAPGVEKVPMPMPLSEPLMRLTAELTGAPPRLIPLVLSLRWAGENDELRRRHWPGVDLFRRFIAALPNAVSAGSPSTDHNNKS